MVNDAKLPAICRTPYTAAATWVGAPSIRVDSARLPAMLANASAERQATFFIGRACAARALQRLGVSGEVVLNPDGSPGWPEGIVGSITHTHGFAAAAVARSPGWRGIGIDSECRRDRNSLQSASALIVRAEEWSRRPPPMSNEDFMLLALSAKESFYKCIYPETGRVLEYEDIELLSVNTFSGTMKLRCVCPPSSLIPPVLDGRYAFSEQCVHTAVEWLSGSSK